MSKVWRFKTKEEFINEGLWIQEKGFPQGWNNMKKMNHLLGQNIIDCDDKCLGKTTFKYDGWSVGPTSYKCVESSSIPAIPVVEGPRIESVELPQFDLDRLAKEVDNLFQTKLKDVISKQNSLDVAFVTTNQARIAKYQQDVDKMFGDIKLQLLAEVAKGHTTIVLSDQMQITIDHMDHPELANVVKSLHLQHKAMLVGPAGTGKTYMVAALATRMDLPFYKYSCSRDSSVHDLLGYKQPRSETYLETTFLKAYEGGGIFLVDEYDAMSGDMSLFFNGIADASQFISIPHRDEKPIAKKHKDFYLIMCGNTWGKGSVDYSGRDFQDMALMDRFRFCRHHIGYHFALEKQLMGENYQFAIALRKSLENTGSYLSTRNIEDIANLIQSGINKQDILSMVGQDLDEEGRKVVNRDVNQFLQSGEKAR